MYLLLILTSLGWGTMILFEPAPRDADLSALSRKKDGTYLTGKTTHPASEKIVLEMARFLEKREAQTAAYSREKMAKWNEHAESQGYRGFEQEIDRYFLNTTPSDRALKVLLVVNHKSNAASDHDDGFVSSAEEELKKDPVGALTSLRGVLDGLPPEGWSGERNYILQLATRLGNNPRAKEAAKSLFLSEVQRPGGASSALDASLPVTAMMGLLDLNPDAATRQLAEQALVRNHAPASLEAVRQMTTTEEQPGEPARSPASEESPESAADFDRNPADL